MRRSGRLQQAAGPEALDEQVLGGVVGVRRVRDAPPPGDEVRRDDRPVDADEIIAGGRVAAGRGADHRPAGGVGRGHCGYRVTAGGTSIAYLSDHQQPSDGSFRATDGAMELCRDADVLVHDAQYTPSEFARKSDWGHCMIEYAVWLAAEAGVRTLVLFHHDPAHDDDFLDVLVAAAGTCGRKRGVDVIGAREGLRLTLGS